MDPRFGTEAMEIIPLQNRLRGVVHERPHVRRAQCPSSFLKDFPPAAGTTIGLPGLKARRLLALTHSGVQQTFTMSMYQGVLYAADPPEGVAREPDQSPDASVIIAVTAIVFPLATISMFIRMYARIVLIKKVAFDDCEYFERF